mmetsp:Transcript_12873/g.18444  ORF Transcript_12873/g.18444 Transcript_12873/m.18444 type:complete len:282 (+) Transcript_12873:41-886(+)
MELFKRSLLAFVIASLMALRGYKRKSLSKNGAAAAWLVGFSSIFLGMRGFLLLLFYLIGTKATKYKMDIKSKYEEMDATCRGPGQVLACSVIGIFIQTIHHIYCGKECPIDFEEFPLASSLACALIAHHATNLADTLSSELGILSKSDPILITSLRRVPRGTNGGISLIGFGCSMLGGSLIGFGAYGIDALSGLDARALAYVLFGTVLGTIGSIIDSILGATLQATYFDEEKKVISANNSSKHRNAKWVAGIDGLSNTQVNLVSVMITSAIGFCIGPSFFR